MDRISAGRAAPRQGRERQPGACSSRPGSSSTATSRTSATAIKSGVREDMTLGVCTNCGGELRVLRGKTGKRFAACVGKEGDEPQCPSAPRASARGAAAARRSRCPQRGTIIANGQAAPSAAGPRSRCVSAGGRGRPWVALSRPRLSHQGEVPGAHKKDAAATSGGRGGRLSARTRRLHHPRGHRRRAGKTHPGGACCATPRRPRLARRRRRRAPGAVAPRARRHARRRGHPRRSCCTARHDIAPWTEALLYAAARAQLVAERPAAPTRSRPHRSCSTATSTRRSPTRASPAAWASTRC